MTLKPYPSITRIAALSAKAGHVVGVEAGVTTVETGTRIVKFGHDRSIRDGEGKVLDMDAAIKLLGISL